VGIVRLGDPGGATKYKSGVELALSIIQAADDWWPQACLDLAAGATLPPDCTIEATTIYPPDQDGCASHAGRRICAGDPFWQAIPPPPFDPTETSISRLAGGADIAWSCPAGVQATPIQDTCGSLRERPECKLQSSSCVAGTEDAQGNCTLLEDTYDCGKEVVIDDGGIRTELQCDGEVTCLGDTCTGGENETNPNFAQVAATLKAAELTALDGACNPETGDCAVFTGQAASCKRVLAGTVDCCQDV
jgi:conjugal transfer mating pair stabilization protein TraN